MPSLASSSNRVIEPALFAARFWRDFYGSMLTHTVRSAMTKLLVLAAGILLVPHARAATNPHLNLVVAIDLTRSVAVKGPDGTTEFQKNVDGVTHILAQVPAGARVSIIGITAHSFAQPYFLLSATVPDDPGYFGERLGAARNEIVRVWKLRSARLQPSFGWIRAHEPAHRRSEVARTEVIQAAFCVSFFAGKLVRNMHKYWGCHR